MWKQAGAHVVSQTSEDEVIAVDLREGSYYSLTGSGPFIWECIHKGHSRESAIQCLEKAYDATPDTLGQLLDGFIDKLVAFKLIELDADDKPGTTGIPSTLQDIDRRPFVSPAIEKYTDMEDVLKTDPIHDFDESGWPNKT